jgi:hypothetical protein
MNAVDDLQGTAEGVRASLEEVRSFVGQACDEAIDLEQSAAAHGWTGIAERMSSTKDILESAASVTEVASGAIAEGITQLATITDGVSTLEVARRFQEIGRLFESAMTGSVAAAGSLDDARASAGETGAHTLSELISSAEDNVQAAQEPLAEVIAGIQLEHSRAEEFGALSAPGRSVSGESPAPLKPMLADAPGASPTRPDPSWPKILSATEYPSKAVAREALSGTARHWGGRFFRGATGKSTAFRIETLEGGGHRLSFFSPANNAGYGKLYVGEFDASGLPIRRYKDTLGPEGLIERKWIQEDA